MRTVTLRTLPGNNRVVFAFDVFYFLSGIRAVAAVT